MLFATKQFPWQIAGIRRENGLTAILQLVPKFSGAFPFYPGQGAYFTFPKIRMLWHPRFFHIISPPEYLANTTSDIVDASGYIEIAIKAVDDWTHCCSLVNEGDIAVCGSAVGRFSPTETQSPRQVFIAGGIGISPFLSVLRHYALTDSTRKVLVLWGAATHDDIILKRVILEADYDMRNLTVVPSLTHDPLWNGEKGRLDSEKLERIIPSAFGFDPIAWLWDESSASYWINGPKTFLATMRENLITLGTPKKNIHLEVIRR